MKVREDGNAEPRSEGEEGQPTIRLSAGDQKALDALRSAVAEALDRKRRLGQYAVIWRDGRAVRIEGEELTSTEPDAQDTGNPKLML